MCAYLLSEDKGCRAVCDREALAQTLFRSRSGCACSSRLSTLSSAVTSLGPGRTDVRRPSTGVDATGVVLVSRVRIRLVSACRERGGTGRVVEDLAVPEDRVGEFDARRPAVRVEQLDLHPCPQHFDQRVVVAVARWGRSMAPARTCELSVNAQEVNCVPWSLWITVSLRAASRCSTAISSLPSRVGWSVMRRLTPEASRRRG
jgi:hypothetical protein